VEVVVMISRALSVLIVFLFVPGIMAQRAAKPRTDSLGDPLPEGAIARIGTLRFKHNPAQGGAMDVALFAPDGSKIVTLSQDFGSIRLWDAESGKDIQGPWSTYNKPHSAVAFSPDSTKLAAVASANFFGNPQAQRAEIIVYDIARGQAVKTIAPIKHNARALAFADGGKTIVSAGEGTVRWWDLDSGKEKRSWTAFPGDKKATDGKLKTFINAALGPDAKSLAVEVAWISPPEAQNQVFNNQVAHEVVGFNLDKGAMTWHATGGRSFSQRYYRVAAGFVVTGQSSQLAFSANGKRVAFPVSPDKVELHDAVTGKLVVPPLETKVVDGNVIGLALSSDGSQLALASMDNTVLVWNVNSPSAPRKFMARVTQNRPYMRSLDFSPNDKKLLVGADADVQVYDVASLNEIQPWEGHRAWIDYVQFSPNGQELMTGCAKSNGLRSEELARWDTATWKRLQLTSLATPPWPNVGNISPDQSVYADRSGAELFDLKSGKLLARLNLPKGSPATRGFFSPKGKHYVFGSQVIRKAGWRVAASGGELSIHASHKARSILGRRAARCHFWPRQHDPRLRHGDRPRAAPHGDGGYAGRFRRQRQYRGQSRLLAGW
jgi:WD40 repeat protein